MPITGEPPPTTSGNLVPATPSIGFYQTPASRVRSADAGLPQGLQGPDRTIEREQRTNRKLRKLRFEHARPQADHIGRKPARQGSGAR